MKKTQKVLLLLEKQANETQPIKSVKKGLFANQGKIVQDNRSGRGIQGGGEEKGEENVY